MTVIQSKYSLNKNDLYETEPWAVANILRHLPINNQENVIWEPAAGNHKIANTLVDNGYRVYTSDIETYKFEHDKIYDFLELKECPFSEANTIITNPPYGKSNRLAVEFCRKSLKFDNIHTIAMLLTSKFDFGKTRIDLFRDNPYYYGEVKLLDRISWANNGKTGTEDHAWFIWSKYNLVQYPRIFYSGKKD